MGSGKYLLIRSIFSRAYSLMASVASMWRNVTESCMAASPMSLWRGSEQLLALRRRQDTQLLTVLGDGPPCDVDGLVLQQLDDLLIRVWMFRVLCGDDLSDLRLDRLRRDLVPVGA